MINVFQPQVGAEELAAVARVFESNWLGKGRRTDEFESLWATRLGVGREHVRSVGCCTAGLFLVGEFLGWRPGDEVILPTISFVGAANAIAARGARPVFADVDERTLNLTLESLQQQLTPRTRAVILLHYGGVPCADLDQIACLCRDRRITLIEDNACSPFSHYRGRPTGTLGDFGIWSFDAMKILVTGDGGLLYAREASFARRLETLAYLGLESSSGLTSGRHDRWWEFEISAFGNRQTMNDVSAAIGIEQLKKVDGFLRQRRAVHERYSEDLASLAGIDVPPAWPDDCVSSYYLFWIQSDRRDELAIALREQGIYTTFRYYPLHWVKKYESTARLPAAQRAAERTLCLPLHQSLTDDDVTHVVDVIRRTLR